MRSDEAQEGLWIFTESLNDDTYLSTWYSYERDYQLVIVITKDYHFHDPCEQAI